MEKFSGWCKVKTFVFFWDHLDFWHKLEKFVSDSKWRPFLFQRSPWFWAWIGGKLVPDSNWKPFFSEMLQNFGVHASLLQSPKGTDELKVWETLALILNYRLLLKPKRYLLLCSAQGVYSGLLRTNQFIFFYQMPAVRNTFFSARSQLRHASGLSHFNRYSYKNGKKRCIVSLLFLFLSEERQFWSCLISVYWQFCWQEPLTKWLKR